MLRAESKSSASGRCAFPDLVQGIGLLRRQRQFAFQPVAYRVNKSGLPLRQPAFALLAILSSGCRAPLPDANSPAAQLYARRCDNCHKPYNPHELTASMWEVKVTMMEAKIQAAGQPPLTPDERDSILEYLKRNAGTE